MRPVVFVSVLVAACAIVAAPAAAQSGQDQWTLNAQLGPAFGTFGTTPNFDVKAGYTFFETLNLFGEFGGLPHAAFSNAASIAPAANVPLVVADPKIHVNGYHYNANAMVTPMTWDRFAPYLTGGVGAFTGSTVATYNVGSGAQRRYQSTTNFATNIGGGISYRANRWLGVNVDYRHFIVNADATEHVNRFTTGISLFVK